ncbi:MAG: glycosyl hydrolase, partial [Myxococcota bacterium]
MDRVITCAGSLFFVTRVGLMLALVWNIGCGTMAEETSDESNTAPAGDSFTIGTRPPAPDTNLTSASGLVSLIRRDTDPDYRYEFANTRFVPPDDRVLLVLGQTLGGINAHVEAFPSEPNPAGWAAYWGVPSMDGVTNTFLNETGGSQNHQELVERFPNTVLQSAMWMVGRNEVAQRTAVGEFDSVIVAYSAWAKQTNRPIYLRLGYEFDGPHNELEPDEYVAAYRRIVDLMRAEGVENIAFVWHSYAAPRFKDYPLSAWYPGDDYVDWVAVSLFGHMYTTGTSPELDAVLAFAREQRKPVMIAEASPIRGIRSETTQSWQTWFVNLLSLTYEKNIKAVSLINEDWERFSFPDIQWSDARLQNNSLVADAWFQETRADRYLKQ